MKTNNIKNAFIIYKENFNTFKKFNEENKNNIKSLNDYKSLKLKIETEQILNNQSKIKNIFKRKNGNKNLI